MDVQKSTDMFLLDGTPLLVDLPLKIMEIWPFWMELSQIMGILINIPKSFFSLKFPNHGVYINCPKS